MDHQFSEALAPLLKRVEELTDGVRRLRADLAEQRPEYLSIKRAALLTDLSYDHIRRAVESGELPASNKGNGQKWVWRIARADLDRWMQKDQGGKHVPPRSELKQKMARHLPGVSC
jgi:excisionase family DNA binding protein